MAAQVANPNAQPDAYPLATRCKMGQTPLLISQTG